MWDDAVRDYEAALSLVAAGDAPDVDEAALLTRLGACYWNLSEARTAWRTLRRAISLYQERGDGVGVARATVELLRIWGPPARQIQSARDALAALGDSDPHLRAELLLRLRWGVDDAQANMDEAMAIAERHGFDDILAVRIGDRAWQAFNDGHVAEGQALHRQAHDVWARRKVYEPAAGALRGSGFATIGIGSLDDGLALAMECMEYARGVHLRFTESLALTDAVGVLFARAEYDRCRALLDEMPSSTDFRADLYRMWIVELAGDTRGALSMMVDPERGGKAPTAMSQTHCAAASVLYRAGNEDAARQELRAWLEVARPNESIVEEIATVWDCVVALASDGEAREVHDALAHDAAKPAPTVFSTLQGRALAPARGAIAMRLGLIDEAEGAYRDGLAWCERERAPVDGGLCHIGLADVASARGDQAPGQSHVARAAELFERHGARLWIERLVKPRMR